MSLLDRLLSRRIKDQIYELQRDREVAELECESLKWDNEELFRQVMSLNGENQILEDEIEDLNDYITALQVRFDVAQSKQLHVPSLENQKKRSMKESR